MLIVLFEAKIPLEVIMSVQSITSGSVNAVLKACDQCGSTDKKIKKCSQCHFGQYCSTDCQRAAWPDHKQGCELRNLFSSTVKVQKIMHINGQKVGIIYSPTGNAVQKGYLSMPGKTALISSESLSDETVAQIKQYAPDNEATALSVGKTFNGLPVLKAFGFE
jgi:hypothetical protein